MKRDNDTLLLPNSPRKRYIQDRTLMDSSSSDSSSDHMPGISSSMDIDTMEDKLLLFSPKQFKSPSYPSSYPPSYPIKYIHESPPVSIATKACPVPVRPNYSFNPVKEQPQQESLCINDNGETSSKCSEQGNDAKKSPLQNQWLTPEYRSADEIISSSSPPFLLYKDGHEVSQQTHDGRLVFPLLPRQTFSTPNNDRSTLPSPPVEEIIPPIQNPIQPPQQQNNRISRPHIGSTNQSAFLQPPESSSSRDSRASDRTHDDKLLLLRPRQFSASLTAPTSLKVPTIPMPTDVYNGGDMCNLPMRQSSYYPLDEPFDVSFRNFRPSPYFLSRNPRIDDVSPPSTSFTARAPM
mmetsp:Transcript_16977/g.25133  ORF Transcript_16977/g.25133 Transcript_16977/m.25133 type:complete len:350 (+) Transcript_16977:102-1151(+)